jgi:septum formation protein
MADSLILASASPRRRELLARLGIRFRVLASGVDETPRANETAQTLAPRLAEAKARAIQAQTGNDVAILAADTVVAVDGEALGKPRDKNTAEAMLRRLAGREHRVYTALALLGGARLEQASAVTQIWFRKLEEREMRAYAAGKETLGAAGGYAIQGGAAAFLIRLVGSYSNVVGLPLAATARLLVGAGFSA